MTKQSTSKQYYKNLALVAILTGVIISAYKLAISFISKNMHALLNFTVKQPFGFPLFLGALLLLAFIVQILCRIDLFSSSGSGIPIIYGLINNKWTVKWQRAIPVRFVTSSLTVGSGLTLGREGPSVQLGGLIGEAIATLDSCQNKENRNDYITTGAAAALAVAFNSPLAAIAFYFEEFIHKITKRNFIAASLTILLAVFTSNLILPNQPVLATPYQFKALDAKQYLLVIGLALVTSASGIAFSYLILNSNKFYKLIRLPDTYKYYLPFIVAAICIYYDPRLFGVGDNMMQISFGHHDNISLLVSFYVVKLFLLFLAFGIKVPGGNLVPLLVLGSLMGNLYASVLLQLGLIEANEVYLFILLALCAHFSAIVRTPITAIILVFEMSGAAFNYLFCLILVSYISYIIAEYFRVPPFYEHLYENMLEK